MKTFSQLGLSEDVLRALPELGITEPTDIQQQAIPTLLKKDTDLIGLAQTGTGKTAAFCLPLLEKIDIQKKHTQGLIVAPTRELGMQINTQLESFSKHIKGLNSTVVYGGSSIQNQMKSLKRAPHIVVATPGRLLDLIKRKAISLKDVGYIILDEADEMLNMGFQEDIDKILSYCPDEIHTWLFSATMPPEIKNIVHKYMNDAVEITVKAEDKTNKNIDHQYALINPHDKTEGIRRFLDLYPDMRGIIFCRTKAGTQKLADDLYKMGYEVAGLHGDMTQGQRERVMKRFKSHGYKALVATDVAARGIDVNDLTHVFHHMLPDDNTYYTHRSGRTARAGKKGVSIALIAGRDKGKIRHLEKMLNIEFTKIEVPRAEDIQEQVVRNWVDQIISKRDDNKVDGKTLDFVKSKLKDLSKDELIEILVSKELGSELDNQRDLNIVQNRREEREAKRNGNKGNKRERQNTENTPSNRFFINIGKSDNATEKELLEFICDELQVEKSAISELSFLEKHSYFNLDEKYVKKVSGSFKGLYVNDREVRVNRDEGRKGRSERGSKRGEGRGSRGEGRNKRSESKGGRKGQSPNGRNKGRR